MPVMYRSIKEDGTIVDCNHYYATRLGYRIEEVLGMSVLDHSPRECHDELLKNIEYLKHTDTPPVAVWMELMTKTGETVNVFRTSRVRRNQNGVEGIDSEFRDVLFIQQIQSIYNLDIREDYEDPKIMRRSVDHVGTIIGCNQSYLDNLGYTKNEVVGISLYEHTAPRSKGNLRVNMENWSAGFTDAATIWMRRKDGSEFPAKLTAVNEMDEDGDIVGRTVSLELIDQRD